MRFRLKPNDDHVHALGLVWQPEPPAQIDPVARLVAERELRGILSDREALIAALTNGIDVDLDHPRYT